MRYMYMKIIKNMDAAMRRIILTKISETYTQTKR